MPSKIDDENPAPFPLYLFLAATKMYNFIKCASSFPPSACHRGPTYTLDHTHSLRPSLPYLPRTEKTSPIHQLSSSSPFPPPPMHLPTSHLPRISEREKPWKNLLNSVYVSSDTAIYQFFPMHFLVEKKEERKRASCLERGPRQQLKSFLLFPLNSAAACPKSYLGKGGERAWIPAPSFPPAA